MVAVVPSRHCQPLTPATSSLNLPVTHSKSLRHRPVAATGPGKQEQLNEQRASPSASEAFKRLIAERRFTCTQCGKCCTGDGEVWIADEEVERIAAHFNMPVRRFCQQYTQAYSKVQGFKLLKSKNNATRDCIFLQPDNTCAIHKVRPLQCSTYPWWPDLMHDEAWAWEKANICEGFDHPDAPPTDKDDAAAQLQAATAMEYRRMLSRKPSKQQLRSAAAGAAAADATAGQETGQEPPPLPTLHSSSGSSSSLGSSVITGQSSHRQHSHRTATSPHPAAGSSVVDSGGGCASSSSSSSNHNAAHNSSSGSREGSQQAVHGGPSRKQAAQDKWRQRLSMLQELSREEVIEGRS